MQLESNNISLKRNTSCIVCEAKLFLLAASGLVLDRAILCNHALRSINPTMWPVSMNSIALASH